MLLAIMVSERRRGALHMDTLGGGGFFCWSLKWYPFSSNSFLLLFINSFASSIHLLVLNLGHKRNEGKGFE